MLAVADQHLTQRLALCGVRYAHRRNVASLPPVTRNLLLRSKTQHCTASLCPDIWCWMSHLAKVRVGVRVRVRVRGRGRGRVAEWVVTVVVTVVAARWEAQAW